MKSIGEFISTARAKESSRSPEERKRAYVLFFLLIVLLAAAVFSMKNFIGLSAEGQKISSHIVPKDGKSSQDVENAAKELNMKLSAFRKLRENTPQLAELAEASGRSPASVVTPPPKVAEETRVPEFVPELKIKALVVLGDKKVCTLDIDGEEPGQIFEQGMTFGGGKGRIVSIDTKGVNWKWANKNYRADL